MASNNTTEASLGEPVHGLVLPKEINFNLMCSIDDDSQCRGAGGRLVVKPELDVRDEPRVIFR